MKKYKNQINHKSIDEYYTPPILVEIILPYLKKNSTIWCPFDTIESEFVHQLSSAGHHVIYSHIFDGVDFFEANPPKCNYIISNPPFSLKQAVFKKLLELNIPFAMVMNVQILNHHETGELFKDFDYELLMPTKRISYDGHPVPFLSGYFCRNVLPKQLNHIEVKHNNVGKNFKPSKMFKKSV